MEVVDTHTQEPSGNRAKVPPILREHDCLLLVALIAASLLLQQWWQWPLEHQVLRNRTVWG